MMAEALHIYSGGQAVGAPDQETMRVVENHPREGWLPIRADHRSPNEEDRGVALRQGTRFLSGWAAREKPLTGSAAVRDGPGAGSAARWILGSARARSLGRAVDPRKCPSSQPRLQPGRAGRRGPTTLSAPDGTNSDGPAPPRHSGMPPRSSSASRTAKVWRHLLSHHRDRWRGLAPGPPPPAPNRAALLVESGTRFVLRSPPNQDFRKGRVDPADDAPTQTH
jgi:hypothetical protein